MSGIPTNIITVQFPDDGGDPAGGGGSFDSGPILDVLRGIQVNVGNINQNVRAILEVLRRMSSVRGGGGGGDGGARGGGGAMRATGGPRAGSRARFAADLLEYRRSVRGGAALGDIMRESHAELLGRYTADRESLSPRELRAATRLRGVEVLGEQVAARGAAAQQREQARQAREQARTAAQQQREQLRMQREQARAAARQATAGVRAAGRRMTGSMMSRMDDLRRRAATPGATVATLDLTEEEQAVLAGRASPSGLPGTRAHFRNVAGVVGRMNQQPAAAPRMSIGGGVMALVTLVGRVLSVIGLVMGAVSTIVKLVMAPSKFAEDERRGFARIDPIFANLEAQVSIQRLRTSMMVAQNPNVRASQTDFAASQIALSHASVPVRSTLSQAMSYVGKQINYYLAGASIAWSGLVNMNLSQMAVGYAIAFDLDLFRGLSARQYYLSTLNTQSNLQFMVEPLVSMTAGRFDPNRPYMGKNANKSNWWTGRP